MKKQLLSLLLVLAMVFAAVIPAAAEEIHATALDPFEEITAEFEEAKSVESYQVIVRPARITGWAALRWAPSHSASLMATYSAGQELTVLKETPNWLQVKNELTGDVGFICRQDTAAPETAGAIHEVNMQVADNGKTDLGVIDINGAFSIQCEMAEGYDIQTIRSASDRMIAIISSADPEKPIIQLSVGYDEAYADVERLNDLDSEALAVLEQTFVEADPMVEITYGDTGLGTRLMIARLNDNGTDYLDFLTIYKGYFVECVMVPSLQASDPELKEEQIQMCVDFLTGMDFVPVADAAGAQVTDGTYITNLTDYDPETNTVKASVQHTVTVPQDEAEALKAGDTLTVGVWSEKIETIEKIEDGTILINDYIYLTNYGGEYHVSFYEMEYLETLADLTLEIPDDLVILDNIDPATGEILEEPVKYTVEQFKEMLTAGTYPDFATDNVYVTFVEGRMTMVERIYTPWQ